MELREAMGERENRKKKRKKNFLEVKAPTKQGASSHKQGASSHNMKQ